MSDEREAVKEAIEALPEIATSSAVNPPALTTATTSSSSSSKTKGKKKATQIAKDSTAVSGDEEKLLSMIRDVNALQQLVDVGADALKGSKGGASSGVGGVSTKELAAMDSLLKRYNMNEMLQNLQLDARGRPTVKDMKNHKFWTTQPVSAYGTILVCCRFSLLGWSRTRQKDGRSLALTT